MSSPTASHHVDRWVALNASHHAPQPARPPLNEWPDDWLDNIARACEDEIRIYTGWGGRDDYVADRQAELNRVRAEQYRRQAERAKPAWCGWCGGTCQCGEAA